MIALDQRNTILLIIQIFGRKDLRILHSSFIGVDPLKGSRKYSGKEEYSKTKKSLVRNAIRSISTNSKSIDESSAIYRFLSLFSSFHRILWYRFDAIITRRIHHELNGLYRQKID